MTASTIVSTGPVVHRGWDCVTSHFGGSRIPDSLKSVFLESNGGKEVHEPPKDKSAFKIFGRSCPKAQGNDFVKAQGNFFVSIGRDARRQRRKRLQRTGDENRGQPQTLSLSGRMDDTVKFESIETKRAQVEEMASSETSYRSDASETTVHSYPSQRSPQLFLDVMLRTLGYYAKPFNTLETSYYNQPTALQVASAHVRLQESVQSQSERRLRQMLSCGISPNPCNRHGDSVLHTACRSGWDTSVRVMIDCGASVQVSDDCGRTPLHSAFFGTQPSFEIVELLLRKDRNLLLLRDRHGATPLAYIPRDQWGIWIDFFYSKRDVFWPRRNKRLDGVEETPAKFLEKPNSRPLENPPNALTTEIAAMVAEGKFTPDEARRIMEDNDDPSCEETFVDGSSYTEYTDLDSLEDDDLIVEEFDLYLRRH